METLALVCDLCYIAIAVYCGVMACLDRPLRSWLIWLAAAAAFLGIARGAAAQTGAPDLPARIPVIVRELHARHLDLAKGDDAARRALTRMIVEQIVYEHPGQGYGWKSASPTRPPSKDCFARQVDEKLWCWDWQNGTTREPLSRFMLHDITGQHFIPIKGVNHLGVVPSPPPSTGPTPEELRELIDALAARVTTLESIVSAQQDAIVGLQGVVVRPVPCSVGKLWGVIPVRVCPEEQ